MTKKLLMKCIPLFIVLGLALVITLLFMLGGGGPTRVSGAFDESMLLRTVPAEVERGALTLRFDPETGGAAIENRETGVRYLTNPEGAQDDVIAKGMNKLELSSQLSVTYLNENNQQFSTNSFKECVQGGTIGYEPLEDGIFVQYWFAESGFMIPVRYTLLDGVFQAEIVGAEIVQTGTNRIVSVDLLPYFRAAPLETEGYFLVPDGCGALISLNSEAYVYQSYNEPVYGRDKSLNTINMLDVKQQLLLPCFGLSDREGGFFAVITDGAAQAGVASNIARKKTSYNNICSSVRFIQFETERLMENSSNASDMTVASEQMIPERFAVQYHLLSPQANSYVDMANLYTSYLVGKGLERSGWLDELPLVNLDLYGSIPKWDTFLGVPYNTTETLTTIEQAKAMARELSAFGGISLRYLGWNKGGIESKTPNRVRTQSGVGSERDLLSLQELLTESSGHLSLVADFSNLYKNGNGLNFYFDSVKNISRAPALQYRYLYSTGYKNEMISPWYLLSPEKAAASMVAFTGAGSKSGFESIAPQGLGGAPYSNFRRNSLSADTCEELFDEALRTAGEQAALVLEAPGGYAIPYATAAVNVPVESSGFDVELYSVPFYQIALSGYVPCFSEAVNLRGDYRDMLLRLVESGTLPSYSLIGNSPDLLADTPHTNLYSASYEYWQPSISEFTARLRSELGTVLGRRITGHRMLEDKVTRLEYDTGACVLVNRTKTPVTVDGRKIPAGDFLFIEG